MPIRSASPKSTIHFMPSSMARVSSFCTGSLEDSARRARCPDQVTRHRHLAHLAQTQSRSIDPAGWPCAARGSTFRSLRFRRTGGDRASAASRPLCRFVGVSWRTIHDAFCAVTVRQLLPHVPSRLFRRRAPEQCGNVCPIRLRPRSVRARACRHGSCPGTRMQSSWPSTSPDGPEEDSRRSPFSSNGSGMGSSFRAAFVWRVSRGAPASAA